mmetsp:Transcript_5427/g.20538  ORF Transcript_5427/g.20538 Transcript_5427/m.20538 type:complete len:817 (+) Transcript_5427:34-2484(+)
MPRPPPQLRDSPGRQALLQDGRGPRRELKVHRGVEVSVPHHAARVGRCHPAEHRLALGGLQVLVQLPAQHLEGQGLVRQRVVRPRQGLVRRGELRAAPQRALPQMLGDGALRTAAARTGEGLPRLWRDRHLLHLRPTRRLRPQRRHRQRPRDPGRRRRRRQRHGRPCGERRGGVATADTAQNAVPPAVQQPTASLVQAKPSQLLLPRAPSAQDSSTAPLQREGGPAASENADAPYRPPVPPLHRNDGLQRAEEAPPRRAGPHEPLHNCRGPQGPPPGSPGNAASFGGLQPRRGSLAPHRRHYSSRSQCTGQGLQLQGRPLRGREATSAAHSPPATLHHHRSRCAGLADRKGQHIRGFPLEEQHCGANLDATSGQSWVGFHDSVEEEPSSLGEPATPNLDLQSSLQLLPLRRDASEVQHGLSMPLAYRVARAADPNGLEDALVAQLLDHRPAVKLPWQALRIRFDAPHKVWARLPYACHQIRELLLKLRGHGVGLRPRYPTCGSRGLRAERAAVLLEAQPHESLGALAHALQNVRAKLVLVLGQKLVRSVFHRPCEVSNDEVVPPDQDFLEQTVHPILHCQLPTPRLMCAPSDIALLVEHRQDPRQLCRLAAAQPADARHPLPPPIAGTGKQLDDGLVVREVLGIPLHALSGVERRLVLEYDLVEVLLQQLVREVDAELLEGVVLEELEAENVEHAHKGQSLTGRSSSAADAAANAQDVVYAGDREREERSIQVPRQRVAAIRGLIRGPGLRDRALCSTAVADFHRAAAQRGLKRCRLHAQQRAHLLERIADCLGTFGVPDRGRERDVTEEECSEQY